MSASATIRVVCPPDLQGYPLGDGQAVIHNRLSGGTLLLDGPAYQALTSCAKLASLAEHAERLAQHGYAPAAEVRARMTKWLEAGLLVDGDRLLAELTRAPAAPPQAITTVCVPTAQRPEVLQRALRTLAPAGRFVVGDDSHTPEEQAQTQALLAQLRRQLPGTIVVIDRSQRARMAEELAAYTGVDLSLVRYALRPESGPLRSYGGNRNALLLALAGRPFVFADDDTYGPLQLPETCHRGLRISSEVAHFQCSFLEPGSSRFGGTRAGGGSLIEAHAALLGRRASELLQRQHVDASGSSGGLLRRLATTGARVAVTQLGAMGDSGTGSLGHYMLLSEPSRQRLLRSEEHYLAAHQSRKVQVWVDTPLVTDMSRCMGMACGVDASELVPPFPPIARNADGVFGLLLSRCFAGALFGWLPNMVQHAPPEPRRTSFDETLREMRGIDCNDALSRLIASASRGEPEADPADNLRRLGITLRDWAAEPLAAFEARLRAIAVRTRAGDVQMLHRLLQQHDFEPSYWAQDLRRAIMALEQGLLDPHHAWPRDLIAALGEQEGRPALRDHVGRFGELLCAWPTLFEAARVLWSDRDT